MPKALSHLKTILTHKRWVAHYCFLCGLYTQGIAHDLSKFSPVEFFESVKYYEGHRSPIEKCKEEKGYSLAWLHHRGRNKHHWEMWLDNFEKGTTTIKMPFKYALEMFCDFLGAGRAYMKDDFTIEAEYKWWTEKRKKAIFHDDTRALLEHLFNTCLNRGIEETISDKNFIAQLKKDYLSSTIETRLMH